MTIHEAQSLSNATVIIVNTKSTELQLHDSVSHAIVAITRHTDRCSYYTSGGDDAIKRLIRKATEATTEGIAEYNLKMAIKDRNEAVMSSIGGNAIHIPLSLIVRYLYGCIKFIL